ncbi:MAG TPA: Omp28-related outer membrane protein [Phaeodactylibacter sp.]|nr:Omp28-related outer membrane protein [Phaeodactylibacter sp.]
MIKKTLLFISALFAFSFLQAQEAPEIQNSMVSKISATWCPPCGGWGWTFFHDLIEDNSDKALLMAVHHSGDLTNSTASNLTDNFGVNSQPRFILNNDDQNASPSNAATKRMEIKNKIDENYTIAPTANAGIIAFLENNTITVQTKTKFFQDAEGEYFINVYIVEDGVVNYQASQGDNAVHKNVLRGGMAASTFGESIVSGTVSAGTEVEKEFSISVDNNWNTDKLIMAAVIWKMENNQFTFVNTHWTNTFSVPTETKDIFSADWDMQVHPTLNEGDANILINTEKQFEDFELSIFNQIGQQVAVLHEGALNKGLHTFVLNTILPKGMYLIHSSNGNAVDTRRMIIR